MIRIPWAKPHFGGREREYLTQALDSTWISGGPFVERFEAEFISRHSALFGLTTSNGTTALHVALLGLGVGPGDEVVVPGYTFVAPANMTLAVGAQPVYADADPHTFCVDPAAIDRAVTARTRAIIVVHVYGNVCDMDALREVAARRRLPLIEDVAEAAFSRYRGQLAGTFGEAGCFSFQATKTITTGEGGFVITPDAELHARLRMIRDHGMRQSKRYWHDAVGFNFRLTNLQAAVGCAQLERIEGTIGERRRLYDLYRARLEGRPGMTLQRFAPEVDPVVWALAVRIDPAHFTSDRDGLIAALREAGVETRPGFYPPSVMPLYGAPPLPVSEQIAASVLALPFYPGLTDGEVAEVCESLEHLRRA
jgi:perosamine synthetase